MTRAKLSSLALTSLTSGDYQEFYNALFREELPTSYGLICDKELHEKLVEEMNPDTPEDSILSEEIWDSTRFTPSRSFNKGELFLHHLWQDLESKLQQSIEAINQKKLSSSSGAILCFFGIAELEIVVGYKISPMGTVSLRPIALRNAPKSVLDIKSMLNFSTQQNCNLIKNAVMSADKLIFQRGTIVHVDRQHESEVFGPTIDTVIMGELIARYISENQLNDKSLDALEIGPGSGLLSCILAHSRKIKSITSVDLNWNAVTCTLKNLQTNGMSADSDSTDIRVRAESFYPQGFDKKFDLIVCNPPYIPSQPKSFSNSEMEYGRAVGGTNLCTDLLKNLDNLISPSGKLLLMASSLSRPEVNQNIPKNFSVYEPLGSEGRQVPLDVDVLLKDDKWLSELSSLGCLKINEGGEAWHRLHPLWIQKRSKEN